jgi:hypothetical protein
VKKMSDTLEIRTNNVPRFTVDGFDVPADVRADFDYIDWEAVDGGTDSATFVQYRSTWYDLGEFTVTNIPGWDGIATDTFFSGTVIRIVDDGDAVIMGRVYS